MSNAKNTIAVEPRAEFGNNASRRLRKASRIPAVVYSNGQPARALSLDADEWKVISGHGAQMVTLVEGGKETPALVREVQFNHLKNYVEHIDFQEVDLTKEIKAMVPIHTIGIAAGSSHGGVLDQELHELPVICRADLLPEAIKVDVSALDVNMSLTAADLKLPEGVKADLPADTIIFNVVWAKEEAEAAPAAEGEAAAEPEAINEKKTEARAAEKEAKEKDAKK